MKRCPKCESQNNDSANYCSACGRELTKSEAAGSTAHVPHPPGTISHDMTSTTFDLVGHRVVQNLGLVRGIVVRSRSVVGTFGASLQTLIGGDITLFTDLCENTRNDAFERMLQHAVERGANAVIGIRYDATEVMQGVTEVLAYGTAVVVSAETQH